MNSIFWFRKDLRLHDNAGLYHALQSGLPMIPIFIFDKNILDELDNKHDRRVDFIHQQVLKLKTELQKMGSDLTIFYSTPTEFFKKLFAYVNIIWRNNEQEFEVCKNGETGYPIVDEGMKELNETGFMHNRVRMIVAGFLVKHLLINWRWGENYFVEKLLDFDLPSNNGA